MNNTEIERKFLVKSDTFKEQATTSYEIMQGYLCKDPAKTIRVRIRDNEAFLTIKSSLLREGIARFELEKDIDLKDAKELIKICLPGVISKTRYIIPAPSYQDQPRCWEVDVFHSGKKAGTALAEIELGNEGEPFACPDWLGEEVTGQPEFYNSNM